MIDNKLKELILTLSKDDLDILLKFLIKRYGLVSLLSSVVVACDIIADELVYANDKKQEDYWRDNSSKIFDVSRKIYDFVKTKRR